MFGLGKKTPFRTPREVAEIRSKITAELRENYPNLERYREIKREVERIVRQMNDLVARKENIAEAISTRDDLQKRFDGLAEKVNKNALENAVEDGQDHGEKNIDFLERKVIRNRAKTLFTVFLEAQESVAAYCREGSRDNAMDLGPLADKIIETVSELNSSFFKKYGRDQEILELKEKVLARMSELKDSLAENSGRLEQQGLRTSVQANVQKIVLSVARELS